MKTNRTRQCARCGLVGKTLLSYPDNRGPEFNYGEDGNQNKDRQHGGLRDCEGWLSLSGSQRTESRNLREALHDQNEDVKIKRHNGGDYVDPAPRAYQVLFVQSKQRDCQDHTSHNADTQSGREPVERKKKSSQAGERRCDEKKCGCDRQAVRSKHPAYNDQSTSDCDKGDNDVQDCEGAHRHPEDHGKSPLFKRMRPSSSALTQQALSGPRRPVPN